MTHLLTNIPIYYYVDVSICRHNREERSVDFGIRMLDAPLFPMHRRTASRWVKAWCHAVGIDRGTYSAHSLRKTFAYQHWLEQGKTDEALVIVSKALGHKNTGTTMDYLGIRRQRIREWQMELSL